MLDKTIDFWELTQLVKERILMAPVQEFVLKHFGLDWDINIFKTDKDEVLQIYNHDTAYTCIGGSSGDGAEWKSNFSAFPLIEGKHKGFTRGAYAVIRDKNYIARAEKIFVGHSRGGAIATVLCDKYKTAFGVGFGVPKVFIKKQKRIDFVNVRNPLDPVVHVVPFFKTVGEVRKVRFAKNPHTKYGDNINKEEVI